MPEADVLNKRLSEEENLWSKLKGDLCLIGLEWRKKEEGKL